ncbi:unnamed protein product [Urochloa decumbens]|uniref:F-box associated beta-propeller type 3 domain-containing protein n=1 Tax=Urochloa decumbens TaxID=240449 RepID=A0ABC9BG38_9POAL
MAAAHVQPSGRQPFTVRPSSSPVAPPSMAAIQAGRLKDALLVVAAHEDATDIFSTNVKLVDAASGAVIGQLDGQRTDHISAAAGLICIVPAGASGSAIRVLNPATGGITDIPAGPTAVAHGGWTSQSSYVFAHISTTKEYKLLRVITSRGRHDDKLKQSCEILTLGGRGQRWRPASSPPVLLSTTVPRQRAVTAGFAHFLTTTRTIGYDGIASFDMVKEEWRPCLLPGPLPSGSRNCCQSNLSLVELNSCLAFVHHDYLSYCIDMWVLEDMGEAKWLQIEPLHFRSFLSGFEELEKGQLAPLIPVKRRKEIFAQPLMVMDDGRIAFWVRFPNGVVRVYDPKARKCEDAVRMGSASSIVGLYKGSQVELS